MECLQWEFNFLMGLFRQLGLSVNVGKMADMVLRTCHVIFQHYEAVNI